MTILFGRTPTGKVIPLSIDESGNLQVVGDMNITHALLNGSIHSDTEQQNPANGSLVVGQSQGGGVYKWGILSGGNTGDVLTKQASGTLAWQAPASGGDLTLISDQTLGAGAASIDFSNIPATYKHLRLVLSLRTNLAGTADNWLLRFNNDSSAIYDSSYWVIYHNAQFATAQTLNGTYANMGNTVGANGTASMFSQHVVDVVDYLSTAKNKHANVQTTFQFGTNTGEIRAQAAGCTWKSTAAISRVTLLPSTGTQFVISSRASLYGLK